MTGPLRHFWFELDIGYEAECPPGVRAGVGITALDRDDALDILRDRVFGRRPVPGIRHEIGDVDFPRLCPWLVLANMTDPGPRGVWFPAGY